MWVTEESQHSISWQLM